MHIARKTLFGRLITISVNRDHHVDQLYLNERVFYLVAVELLFPVKNPKVNVKLVLDLLSPRSSII